MHRSNVSSPRAARRRVVSLSAQLLTAGALTVAAGSLAAQTTAPRYFVSTTSAVSAPGTPTIGDGDVVLVQEGAAPEIVRATGHWRATAGFDLGDIDALARRPGSTPGAAGSIAFSLLSNVGTLLDGDVLALADGGGVEVLVSENVLTAALGVADGSIDVDAMAWDDLGRLHVSLQSDVAGTPIGDVKDGDILRLEPDGTLKRVFTEMDVEEKLFLATGSTAAVGDVQGLDIVNGEAIVAIQSPSAYDGAVLDCGQNPTLLLTETGAGLGGAELDALMAVDEADLLPRVRFDADSAPSGGTVHVEFRGEPNGGQLVLWSGNAGHVPFFGPGFGAWYLDPADPWLNAIFSGPTLPLVPLDPNGLYATDYTLPFGVEGIGLDGKPGWTFQTMDLLSLELSAPFRLELF